MTEETYFDWKGLTSCDMKGFAEKVESSTAYAMITLKMAKCMHERYKSLMYVDCLKRGGGVVIEHPELLEPMPLYLECMLKHRQHDARHEFRSQDEIIKEVILNQWREFHRGSDF